MTAMNTSSPSKQTNVHVRSSASRRTPGAEPEAPPAAFYFFIGTLVLNFITLLGALIYFSISI